MSKRTYPSGRQKRLKATEKKKRASANVHKLDTYFATTSGIDNIVTLVEHENDNLVVDLSLSEPPVDTDADPNQDSSDNSTRNIVDTTGFHIDNPYPSDRGLYPTVIADNHLRDMIAKHGPCKPKGPFPTKPGSRRKFSTARYKGRSKAGINIQYRWLCYSPTLDCAFCHSCWLFADRQSTLFHSEWIDGISDWGQSEN